MSWTDGPVLGFDTETTGVDVDHDRIVTAALVRRDADGTRTRTWLIDPGVPIPEAAAAIHGISTEHARAHGEAPAGALEQIAAELAEAMRTGVPVVAYNAAFDLCLLEAELRRHGLPTVSDRLGGAPRPVIDPLVLDRCEDRYRRGKRKLVDLCGVYQVVDTGSLHTADVDVVATLDVLEQLVVRFPHLGDWDLDTLHDYQMTAHQDWAEGFNRWRAGRGMTGPGASTFWPTPALGAGPASAAGQPAAPAVAAGTVPGPHAAPAVPTAVGPTPGRGDEPVEEPVVAAVEHDPDRDRAFAGEPVQGTLLP